MTNGRRSILSLQVSEGVCNQHSYIVYPNKALCTRSTAYEIMKMETILNCEGKVRERR